MSKLRAGAAGAQGRGQGGRRHALQRQARGRPRLRRQEELKAAGVAIIPQQNFTSFDEAIAFVKASLLRE